MVENIKEHYSVVIMHDKNILYLKCLRKKFIKEENAKYYKDLKKRMDEDVKLANKLSKEKFFDATKDEFLA